MQAIEFFTFAGLGSVGVFLTALSIYYQKKIDKNMNNTCYFQQGIMNNTAHNKIIRDDISIIKSFIEKGFAGLTQPEVEQLKQEYPEQREFIDKKIEEQNQEPVEVVGIEQEPPLYQKDVLEKVMKEISEEGDSNA